MENVDHTGTACRVHRARCGQGQIFCPEGRSLCLALRRPKNKQLDRDGAGIICMIFKHRACFVDQKFQKFGTFLNTGIEPVRLILMFENVRAETRSRVKYSVETLK